VCHRTVQYRFAANVAAEWIITRERSVRGGDAMALTTLTALLPQLLVSRENRGKHDHSVTLRAEPSRCVPTLKAIEELAAPYMLEPIDGSPMAFARNIERAFELARQLDGSGWISQRGRVVGFWGELPKEQP
jgi:hypothetical protein